MPNLERLLWLAIPLLLAASPPPGTSGESMRDAVPGDHSCPVLLFALDARGKLTPGKDLVRSGACGWPEARYEDETYPRDLKPSLAERTRFAQVVLSCDHLFSAEQESAELTAWILASPYQPGVPGRFRIKSALRDYLRNLAKKDGGVWVFGRGKFGFSGEKDPRPPVVGCKPRAWLPGEAHVSRSALVVSRRPGALDEPPYPAPDEAGAPRAPASRGDDAPADMSFSGK